MLGFTQDERFLYFVLEFIPGGELFTYLRNLGKLENNEAVYATSSFPADSVSLGSSRLKSPLCSSTSTQKISSIGNYYRPVNYSWLWLVEI